jgi:hypothetical protein
MFFLVALAVLCLASLSEGLRALTPVRDIMSEYGVSAGTIGAGLKNVKVVREVNRVELTLANGKSYLTQVSSTQLIK